MCSNNMLNDILRSNKKASMHPYSRHWTKAGPITHYTLPQGDDGSLRGLVFMGMRKYGMLPITIKQPWRYPAYALRERYCREIENAIVTAWRC